MASRVISPRPACLVPVKNGEFGDTGIVSHTNQGLVSGTFVVLGLAGALLLARRRRG